MEQKTAAASQQVLVELEAARLARSALKHQQEALEEREATIAKREVIIEDVSTFLDAMKSPVGETLRQRFDQFMGVAASTACAPGKVSSGTRQGEGGPALR